MNLRLPPRPSLSVKRHKRDRFSPCVGVLVCTYHQELFILLYFCAPKLRTTPTLKFAYYLKSAKLRGLHNFSFSLVLQDVPVIFVPLLG